MFINYKFNFSFFFKIVKTVKIQHLSSLSFWLVDLIHSVSWVGFKFHLATTILYSIAECIQSFKVLMTWGKWCFMEGKYTQRGFDLNFQLNAKETYLNCRKTWTLIFKNKSIKEIKRTKNKDNSYKTRNFFKSILLHSNWHITLKRGIINLPVWG